MDWPTAIATVAPIAGTLAASLVPVARGVVRLADAAERIATRLEGADYVALPRPVEDRTDDVISLDARRRRASDGPPTGGIPA